uniref:Uncharacterized protein n=1 Tax=Arundo donax TaxID=35708 RepID=A0A0A9HLD3_ARUDO
MILQYGRSDSLLLSAPLDPLKVCVVVILSFFFFKISHSSRKRTGELRTLKYQGHTIFYV